MSFVMSYAVVIKWKYDTSQEFDTSIDIFIILYFSGGSEPHRVEIAPPLHGTVMGTVSQPLGHMLVVNVPPHYEQLTTKEPKEQLRQQLFNSCLLYVDWLHVMF